jgi:hypothetical protein
MKIKIICACMIAYMLSYTALLHAQTSALNKVIDAFSKTIKDNPNDTSSADMTMKVLGNIVGGNGVSTADSAAAIQKFMTARGGNGFHYQYITTLTSKQRGAVSDTSNLYFNENGEGRSEMNLPAMMGVKGRNALVVIAHTDQRRYSLVLDASEKSYTLNVLDSSILNLAGGKYQVTKIGNENVLGYDCVHAKLLSTIGAGIFSSSTATDVWTSTAVPGYALIKTASLQSISPTMMLALEKTGCGGFFVKMTSQGKEHSMTMTLARAQQQNLPASMFRIPSGYTQSNENMLFHMQGTKK